MGVRGTPSLCEGDTTILPSTCFDHHHHHHSYSHDQHHDPQASKRLSRDAYLPRSVEDLDRRLHNDEDQGQATVELAAIITTASAPVTQGASSPPLDQSKPADFVPPTRPKSTPFPNAHHIHCRTCQPDCTEHDTDLVQSPPSPPIVDQQPAAPFKQLPVEIQECILDHIFGYRVSTTSPSSLNIPSVSAKGWSTALRHSRRKENSNLALVFSTWRVLVQQRLFRHIKLQATVASGNDVVSFFTKHAHLRDYVKHIEVWFPVFQPRPLNTLGSSSLALPTVSPEGIASATYALPTDNSTLEEVFHLVSSMLPGVHVMTLEGGERKKAPRVRFNLPSPEGDSRNMPKIPSVRTLIVKGQWNIIRSWSDWEYISRALPNLNEWHGSYAKPKSKSYISMAGILQTLDRKITNLNLCLEGDYKREISCPPFYVKVCEQMHWCEKMARAANRLEQLSYTGRVCHEFFDALSHLTNPRTTKLKSIDLTVKNCCRPASGWSESGSGIADMHFINSFEQLVLGGIRALQKLRSVQFLRIRYIDLGKSFFSSLLLSVRKDPRQLSTYRRR